MRSEVIKELWGKRMAAPRVGLLIDAGLSATLVGTCVHAQKPEEKSAEKPAEKSADKTKEEKKDEKKPEEKIVQTKHAVKIGGQEIKYTATAGTILLKLEDGTPKASVFYIAYTKD